MLTKIEMHLRPVILDDVVECSEYLVVMEMDVVDGETDAELQMCTCCVDWEGKQEKEREERVDKWRSERYVDLKGSWGGSC